MAAIWQQKSDSPGKVGDWNNHKNPCERTEAELFKTKGEEMRGNKARVAANLSISEE